MLLVLVVYSFTFAVCTATTSIPETLSKAPIGIVDQDRSSLSTRLVDAFYPFLATVAHSMPQFGLLLILVLLPLQMLSGGVTPRESMPEVVQRVMRPAPTTHFIMLAQAILYRGAGLAVVWPQRLALAGIGVALFVPALVRFRKTLGAMA